MIDNAIFIAPIIIRWPSTVKKKHRESLLNKYGKVGEWVRMTWWIITIVSVANERRYSEKQRNVVINNNNNNKELERLQSGYSSITNVWNEPVALG